MPPKAKRYRVLMLMPILNSWRAVATGLTKADADKLIGMLMYDARKEELNDDK